jgi:tRNA threonylcarbamoyladenosine biosynthesis protein TsaB
VTPARRQPAPTPPRNVVAIETATETVGVAVCTADGVVAEMALTGRRRHVETLTPALEQLLGHVGLTPRDLSAVAVDVGPGLFTGLRVGVSAAKGLAQSLDIGVIAASSLDILAAGAARVGHRGLVLSCIDARRGEVFAAVHHIESRRTTTERMAPGLFAPAALAEAMDRLLRSAPVLGVGDGATRYAKVLGAVPGVVIRSPALSFPPPAALLHVALSRLDAGEPPADAACIVPLYMREADAKSNFARAERA